jgi:hypothetical protein
VVAAADPNDVPRRPARRSSSCLGTIDGRSYADSFAILAEHHLDVPVVVQRPCCRSSQELELVLEDRDALLGAPPLAVAARRPEDGVDT